MKGRISAVLLTILSFTSCVTEDDPENTGIIPGDSVPVFTVTLDDGSTLSTPSLRGKTVLIEFFNTGCPDCREGLPAVDEVYRQFKEDDDVVIFAVAREEDAASIGRYWEEKGFSIPYSAQEDRNIYNLFATVGIPRTYIVNRSGMVTTVFGDSDLPAAEELHAAILSAR